MSIAEIHKLFLASEGLTTDTRNLIPKGVFLALKGANFNGNEYALKAIEEGCLFAIVDEEKYAVNEKLILVDDCLKTLQDLANFHRKQFDIPVIGITGSNGKTTTKELIGAVLSSKYNTLVTQGNLNNHLGVPFTLLQLNQSHEIAIVEMGANKPFDIKELVDIAEPTHGVITNIGAAHLEGFGSIQGVINTKKELYDYIEKSKGHLFYNAADEILKSILPAGLTYSSYNNNDAEVSGVLVAQDPFVQFKWTHNAYTSGVLKTQLVGQYNFINFLSAIAIGVYFKVTNEAINKAIEHYQPTNNRSQILRTERNTLIVDCYNANVTSMQAALESFILMDAPHKLVVLGDMKELGITSLDEHEKLVRFVKRNKLNAILIGSEFEKVKGELKHFNSAQELLEADLVDDLKDTLVLLKGSRSIRLESLIPSF